MNLLVTLDALLETNSVTLAAERLRLSPSATSRTLTRLRHALGDPLLVRAGQRLVPTPRALALRGEVGAVVRQAQQLLTPGEPLDPAPLTRDFTIQAADAFVVDLIAPLTTALARHAPGVCLHFVSDGSEGTVALRDGRVDLEIGVLGRTGPETLVEPLTGGRLTGVAAAGRPLASGPVTVDDFAAADHIVVSPHGVTRGPVDTLLAAHHLSRRVVATVSGFTTALLAVQGTDLTCLAPVGIDPDRLRALGLVTFEVPLDLPPLPLGMTWHPRNHADTAHRWLRDHVRAAFESVSRLKAL
ncbi:LysR substrate-binding domain-containing protein [Streptomyces sp. NPDC004542]|uniref:LysR substrate-binding domain-containing protein n=1 Tax=Streptomyces sp. NPDC004542 TaxID=3154281 RepID=UPI0033BD9A50